MAETAINNADLILFRALESLSNNTQLTRTSAGSKIRSILRIISEELEAAQTIMQANVALSMVNGATGTYLDLIGETLGVYRATAKNAELSAASGGLTIEAPPNLTFGDMNSGLTIEIPSGTIISNATSTIFFRITKGLSLDPNESSANVGIVAVNTGSDSNIASAQLSEINFVSYSGYPDQKLVLTNEGSIESGEAEESDGLYRYKIQNALFSAEKANRTAIRLSVLSLPGVRDVTIKDLARGIGTADILVETDSTEVGHELWSQIRFAIDTNKAAGVDIQIREPKNVGLDLGIVLVSDSLFSAEAIRIAIRQKISDFIGQVSLGGTASVNRLAAVIATAHPGILSVGEPGRPIRSMSVWRTSAYSNQRIPFQIIAGSDIILGEEERLVFEGSPNEAIGITIR